MGAPGRKGAVGRSGSPSPGLRPPPGAREGGRGGRRHPVRKAPRRLRHLCPGSGGVGVRPGAPPLLEPPRHATPGAAGPPSRSYPRHDAQNGVRLPDQGMGVEGAPGFARSVRTPFHRGCTRAVPPAWRAPPSLRVRGAPAPSPARAAGVVEGSRQGASCAEGAGERASSGPRALVRGGARVADRAEGALVVSVVSSLRSPSRGRRGGGAANTGRPRPRAAALPGRPVPITAPRCLRLWLKPCSLFVSCRCLPPNIVRQGPRLSSYTVGAA